MKRRIDRIIIVLIALLIGCDSSTHQRPWDTLDECERNNTELSMQVEELKAENEQLIKQVTTLQELDKHVQFKDLNTLDKIRIGKRTGFYDKDDDGTKETLVVYLEPLDNQQDYIKAVGDCRVDIWDLNQPEDQVTTTSFEFGPEYLNKNWGGNIFSSYYRLINQSPRLTERLLKDNPKELTIKVTFGDYIGGKLLTDQKVIQP